MTRTLVLISVLSGLALSGAYPVVTHKNFTIDLTSYGKDLFGQPQLRLTLPAQNFRSFKRTEDEANPEEMGDHLEGDILVPEASISMRTSPNESTSWPDGVVPFEIEGTFDDEAVDTIYIAMEFIMSQSCIVFVPRTDEADYVVITNLYNGCWSAVGRMGGRQQLNLQTPPCVKKIGTSMHELMHVLGFPHEQNRKQRDEYVVIVEQNIRPQYRKNFYRHDHTQDFGVDYDYGSIMHYSQRAFSVNGHPTIVPVRPLEEGVEIGQRHQLSESDLARLNRMYCGSGAGTATPPPETAGQRQPYNTLPDTTGLRYRILG